MKEDSEHYWDQQGHCLGEDEILLGRDSQPSGRLYSVQSKSSLDLSSEAKIGLQAVAIRGR